MSAQLGANAGAEFAGAERLHQVVVGARVQGCDLAALGTAGREHDHRHGRPLPQFADEFHAVAVGQTQIEHHQVGATRASLDEAALVVLRLVHRVALGLQRESHEAADMGLVFDDQNLAAGWVHGA